MNEIKFFMPMEPPTVTAQEHKIAARGNRPIVYDTPEIKIAKEKLLAHLARHVIPEPLTGPVELQVYWIFDGHGNHEEREWKTTKPDTDNLEKMLKDCMTRCRFWKDDAQVVAEYVWKIYTNKTPGIMVCIRELGKTL